MKIIFMQGNIVHWITPYESLEDVPEHPSSDIYIEAPDEVQEGWVYDGNEFFEPEPEPELDNKMSSDQAQRLLTAKATLGLTLPIETEVEAQVALLEGLPLPEPEAEGEWAVGEKVAPGVKRTYNGITYIVLEGKGHVTQANWAPDTASSLWTVVKSTGDPWVQPQGSHDAYKLGAIVTHKSKTWISTANNNVWEPGVHGWEIVSE